MKKFGIALIALAAVGMQTPAQAATGEQVKAFLQSVGCSRLPTGACEALSATNAKNILKAYQSRLSAAYCGSGNFSQAKQLYEMGNALDAAKCKRLLDVLK